MIINVHIETLLNSKQIVDRIDKKAHRIQIALDALVLKDSNYFCPLETGGLQKSAMINSTLGSGLLSWKTPYAKRQYYGDYFDHSKQRNPNACARWFDAAKARWHSQWVGFVNEWIKRSNNS